MRAECIQAIGIRSKHFGLYSNNHRYVRQLSCFLTSHNTAIGIGIYLLSKVGPGMNWIRMLTSKFNRLFIEWRNKKRSKVLEG